jgi:hypothetical protein
MTPKHLIRVNFTEITAVEVVCSNCKAVTSIPIPVKRPLFADLNCIGCNAVFWGRPQERNHDAVALIVQALSNWSNAADKAIFSLQFSVEGN